VIIAQTHAHAVTGMTSNSYRMGCFPRAFAATLTTERPKVIESERIRIDQKNGALEINIPMYNAGYLS